MTRVAIAFNSARQNCSPRLWAVARCVSAAIWAAARAGSAALAGAWPIAINRPTNPFTRAPRKALHTRGNPMKLVLTLIGVVLLVIAAVYFVVPADQLPGFFPGHEAGVAKVHMKHG